MFNGKPSIRSAQGELDHLGKRRWESASSYELFSPKSALNINPREKRLIRETSDNQSETMTQFTQAIEREKTNSDDLASVKVESWIIHEHNWKTFLCFFETVVGLSGGVNNW